MPSPPRFVLRSAAVASALATAVLVSVAAARAEPVTFAREGMSLRGELFRPAGSGPFPAVVALHGCSGLYRRDGDLSSRHADWAKRLTALGYIVLFPDSFGSRGAGSQCQTDERVTRPRERVGDAIAAKLFLQSRADVKAGAISLLGWSNGGSTVLHAVAQAQSGFAAAVALYPGCRIPSQQSDWHARIPLLILIGAADDWTPAAPCEALAERSRAAGEPASIVTYPEAWHDFDHPGLAVHENRGLAYTAGRNGFAHSGTNPAARADALARVPAFLAR